MPTDPRAVRREYVEAFVARPGRPLAADDRPQPLPGVPAVLRADRVSSRPSRTIEIPKVSRVHAGSTVASQHDHAAVLGWHRASKRKGRSAGKRGNPQDERDDRDFANNDYGCENPIEEPIAAVRSGQRHASFSYLTPKPWRRDEV